MATTKTVLDTGRFRVMEVGVLPSGASISADVWSAGGDGYVLGSVEVGAGFAGGQLAFSTGYTKTGPWAALVTDDQAEVVYAVTPGVRFAVPGELFRSYPFLRIRSGTVAAPVVQTTDVTITLVSTRPV
jgi:hypothetical protein